MKFARKWIFPFELWFEGWTVTFVTALMYFILLKTIYLHWAMSHRWLDGRITSGCVCDCVPECEQSTHPVLFGADGCIECWIRDNCMRVILRYDTQHNKHMYVFDCFGTWMLFFFSFFFCSNWHSIDCAIKEGIKLLINALISSANKITTNNISQLIWKIFLFLCSCPHICISPSPCPSTW